uniref:TIL domain-containing protein n=1 Tax=Anopheles arabiensis TaxID=7173 RepID=A0A182HT13_ANOAR
MHLKAYSGIHVKCGPNEVYYCCGMCFELTCDNMSRDRYCNERCYKGCYCADGYTRRWADGGCVRDAQCAAGSSGQRPVGILVRRCPRNELYSCCGPCVQKTCSTMNQNVYCFVRCTEGCVCASGYVRRVHGGECIPARSCPRF